MKERRIIESGDIWEFAHLLDGQPDPEIAELFDGHHVIPTPFRSSTPIEQVAFEIRKQTRLVVVITDEQGNRVAPRDPKWSCSVYSSGAGVRAVSAARPSAWPAGASSTSALFP